MTEKQLIESIYKGDSEAFKYLVEKYKDFIYRVALGILHHKEDAEDITQDVFLEVYKSIADFRKEAQISTWLYRIAINKSINLAKKNKRKVMLTSAESNTGMQHIMANLSDTKSKNIEMIMEEEERKKIVAHCLDKLPKNQKIAFVLHKFDQLTYIEISTIMDMSVSAVESLMHRAKKNLTKTLTEVYKKILF